MNIEQTRFNMIEQQIRPWGVLDLHILDLLALIKREDFCSPEHKALAFVDMELPYGDAKLGQVMLAPRVEARLLQDLHIKKHEKVLEIGTGSGYMAALLAHRAASVLSLEIEPSWVEQARKNLRKADVSNVEVRQADGAAPASWTSGPFDVIVLSGSVAQVPAALLAQLKVGGRLAAIVGVEPQMRATFITRTSSANDSSAFSTNAPWDSNSAGLRHFAAPSQFRF